jgi:uncharacterized protein YciI
VEYFVHGRDRPGSVELKIELAEQHWSYMDGYQERFIARGPTLTGGGDDAEPTGSLHIVDLPDAEAARTFAQEDPYHRAGVFETVLVCRFRNLLGRTMWDFTGAVEGYGRFLVITPDPAAVPTSPEHLIGYGDLLDLEAETPLGRVALVEAPHRDAAAAVLATGADEPTEVHHWRFGGRPA